jgi:hypothetical protein
MRLTTRLPAGTAAGLIIIALVLLAGCGAPPAGTSSSPGAGSARARQAAVPGAPAAAPVNGAHAAGSSGAGQRQSSGNPVRLAPAGQAIVYTASMTVRVRDVGQAAARAAQIAGQAGGYVSQENAALRSGRAGHGTAAIQLKIPVAAYPAVLARLAGLGAQLSLRQQAQDVTQQVADTASRVASDQAAITQLRALLARSGSVGDLLAVQDQINLQESDLEAMQAQQRALNHQIVYATVSLQLKGPVARAAARGHRPKGPSGFVSGLTSGWKALATGADWLVTALGAVLPIAAACALAGYLGYRVLRRVQRRGTRPRRA